MENIETTAESPVAETTPELSAPSTYEAEAMNRRKALARLGFMAGAAAVAALSSDDLTRLVGREMQKREFDNEVARKVADEFASAGLAFAADPCDGCGSCTHTRYTKCVRCARLCNDFFFFGKYRKVARYTPGACVETDPNKPNANCEACNGSYHKACISACWKGSVLTRFFCLQRCDAQVKICEANCQNDEGNGTATRDCWVNSGLV